MPVTEPEKLWVVLDQDSTVYAAAHHRACHEHINDAIDNDVQDAGKMVVREYVSLKAHSAELARLRAENERLRADAARFQWLARADGCPFSELDDVWSVPGQLANKVDEWIAYDASNATTTGPRATSASDGK